MRFRQRVVSLGLNLSHEAHGLDVAGIAHRFLAERTGGSEAGHHTDAATPAADEGVALHAASVAGVLDRLQPQSYVCDE